MVSVPSASRDRRTNSRNDSAAGQSLENRSSSAPPPQPEKSGCDCNDRAECKPFAMFACPELRARRICSRIKPPVRRLVTRRGFPQIVRPVRVFELLRLLTVESSPREIMIEQSGEKFVADDRGDGWQPHIHLAPRMVRCVNDCVGRNFRLIDWRHWLCLAAQSTFHPIKLRRVQCRHLNHAEPDAALVVDQLATQRIAEALDRVLRSAIGRLERNPAVSPALPT